MLARRQWLAHGFRPDLAPAPGRDCQPGYPGFWGERVVAKITKNLPGAGWGINLIANSPRDPTVPLKLIASALRVESVRVRKDILSA
jgi:hypothetical protein